MSSKQTLYQFIMKPLVRGCFAWLAFALGHASVAATTMDKTVLDPARHSVVALMYHHISDKTPASTSVSPKVFKEHIEYVSTHFNVISLSEALNHLQLDTPLAPNSMVITFDDGYANILENGHALLTQLAMPYTIFINPDRIGKEAGQLTWQQVKQMKKDGVTFANHTRDHLHLLNKLDNESEHEWLARVWQNIETAQTDIEKQLGDTPKWLAYPFGEYNGKLRVKMRENGYIGFGQHSGAMSKHSDFSALPRFPAAGIYANLKTLKVKMNSLALPLMEIAPADPQRRLGDTVVMSFRYQTGDVVDEQFNCFFQGEAIAFTRDENKVTISTDIPLPTGRSRVNCTAPSRSQKGRYYWYSQPFFMPNEQGQFPD